MTKFCFQTAKSPQLGTLDISYISKNPNFPIRMSAIFCFQAWKFESLRFSTFMELEFSIVILMNVHSWEPKEIYSAKLRISTDGKQLPRVLHALNPGSEGVTRKSVRDPKAGTAKQMPRHSGNLPPIRNSRIRSAHVVGQSDFQRFWYLRAHG